MTHTACLILIFFLILIVGFLCKKLYDYSIIILKVEESIELSLDVLDKNYKSINEVLNVPIFFDSIEVRNVIANIKECHQSILFVANKLTNDIGLSDEINKENKEK